MTFHSISICSEQYKILKYSEALKYSEGNFSLFKNIGKLTRKPGLHSPREVQVDGKLWLILCEVSMRGNTALSFVG